MKHIKRHTLLLVNLTALVLLAPIIAFAQTINIDRVVAEAKADTSRPTLVVTRTHIGYGSPGKQDSFEAHGSPLGAEETKLTKQKLGWPPEPFHLPEEALARFREALTRGQKSEADWRERFAAYKKEFPELGRELEQALRGELTLPSAEATRRRPSTRP